VKNKLVRFRRLPTQKETRLGTWRLTPNHDLTLTLRRSKTQPFEETLTFQGNILTASAHALIFSVRTKEENGKRSVRLLRLKGFWRADARNRLVFHVRGGKNKTSPLTFDGIWEVGKHHEILYRYRKRHLATQTEKEEKLILRGAWEVQQKNRITYLLDYARDSRFDFRATFQSASLQPRKDAIRFQVGIRLSGQKRKHLQKVVFFGKWKFKKKTSLSFEMEYEGGKVRTLSFGAQYAVTPQNQLIVSLKNQRGERLGIAITMTRSFLKRGGKAFLRGSRDSVESRIEGGFQVPF